MAKRVFSNQDRGVASRIAEIVYCNPFEGRRWELEREVLNEDFKEPEWYVGIGDSRELLVPNLEKLLFIAKSLLDTARSKISNGAGEWLDADKDIYQSLTHFVAFHEVMSDFDDTIENMLCGGQIGGRIGYFAKCRDILRYYLNTDDSLRLSKDEEGQYFAFYFQLRRAWVTIFKFIVGRSDGMRKLRARIWQSSFTKDIKRYQRSLYDRMGDIVTLITGPSGSGKELVARAVGLSRFVPFDPIKMEFAVDISKVFLPINLSALSPTLIESELFGHKKGAFTGALQDRRGYFEECGRYGTVFLDEIGETDPSIQVKLLRVLQTRQFQRLGDTSSHPFVGKVMAATNRELPREIEEGRFREDFYFRLCADRINTPSLAELISGSSDELECFVSYIAYRVAGKTECADLTEESCSWIRKKMDPSYAWPGNFRELEQCVRNILVSGEYNPETFNCPEKAQCIENATRSKMTASELLQSYAQVLYKEQRSYEEVAKILQVDRRTAKRYVVGD
ncbi:sigma-54 factor interaction domain-containing protein [Puniceicoccaceae bacterium K14]|nr:sigma-54 factor interaction domain-containing protein [Puniceicoccaceae bacterium K14]